MRQFAGTLRLSRQSGIRNVKPLTVGKKISDKATLAARGVGITAGTIVDATLLPAPSSTKNREQQRDPEMHPTRKGKQCAWAGRVRIALALQSTSKASYSSSYLSSNDAPRSLSGMVRPRPELFEAEPPPMSIVLPSRLAVCSCGSQPKISM
jgi:hypothetical protein